MFYEVFSELCQKKGMRPSVAAEACGLNRSSVTGWKKKGYTPRGEALQAIADFFGVSIDYLLEKENAAPLSGKEERDLGKKIEEILDLMEDGTGLMFDGQPLSSEALESIKNAMTLGMRAAKLEAKEKYTPKKYRKG